MIGCTYSGESLSLVCFGLQSYTTSTTDEVESGVNSLTLTTNQVRNRIYFVVFRSLMLHHHVILVFVHSAVDNCKRENRSYCLTSSTNAHTHLDAIQPPTRSHTQSPGQCNVTAMTSRPIHAYLDGYWVGMGVGVMISRCIGLKKKRAVNRIQVCVSDSA